MENKTVTIDPDLCNLCGICVEVCTRNIIELGEESARLKAPERCILCGHCKSVCPMDAPILPALDADEFEPVLPKDRRPRPDDLLAFFRSRRSIRLFKKESVAPQDLDKLVQAGRYIPSGGNRQPVCFTIVHTPEMIESLRTKMHRCLADQAADVLAAYERHQKDGTPLPPRADIRLGYAPLWRSLGKLYEKGKDLLFFHAPAVAVLHCNPARTSAFNMEAGLAAMQMALMAESLELGTCFCGFLISALNNSPELKSALDIPETHQVPVTFMIGHPDVTYLRVPARNPAKVVYL